MINLNLDKESVEVGSQLAGSCTWNPDRQDKKSSLDLTIGWRTEGRGDVDKKIIYETQLKPSDLLRFTCNIPVSGPISYHGSLLTIIWEVVVTRKKMMSKETLSQKFFRVVPKTLN